MYDCTMVVLSVFLDYNKKYTLKVLTVATTRMDELNMGTINKKHKLNL